MKAKSPFRHFTDEINRIIAPRFLWVSKNGHRYFRIQWCTPGMCEYTVAGSLNRTQTHVWLEGFVKGLRVGQGKPPIKGFSGTPAL